MKEQREEMSVLVDKLKLRQRYEENEEEAKLTYISIFFHM